MTVSLPLLAQNDSLKIAPLSTACDDRSPSPVAFPISSLKDCYEFFISVLDERIISEESFWSKFSPPIAVLLMSVEAMIIPFMVMTNARLPL